MKRITSLILLFTVFLMCISGNFNPLRGQSAMINVDARKSISLNGIWEVIPDPTGAGEYRQVWLEKKPVKKTDFVEYSFEGGPTLQVPGDFNTQMPELTYEEGTVWYRRIFNYQKNGNRRLFFHFGAVNYIADVYLNGNKLGSHEGGFTPFQFEVTDLIREGRNSIVVKVNNQRVKDGLPGL